MKKTLCNILSGLVLTTPLFSYNAALAQIAAPTYRDFSYQQCAALSDQSAQKTKDDILRQAAETLRPYKDLHREFIALFQSLDQPRDDANRFQLMACTVSPRNAPTDQHRVSFLFQDVDNDDVFNPGNDLIYHIPENKSLGLKNSPFLDVPGSSAPPAPCPPPAPTEERAPPAPYEESAPPAPSAPYEDRAPPAPSAPYENRAPPAPSAPYENRAPPAPSAPYEESAPPAPSAPYEDRAPPLPQPLLKDTLKEQKTEKMEAILNDTEETPWEKMASPFSGRFSFFLDQDEKLSVENLILITLFSQPFFYANIAGTYFTEKGSSANDILVLESNMPLYSGQYTLDNIGSTVTLGIPFFNQSVLLYGRAGISYYEWSSGLMDFTVGSVGSGALLSLLDRRWILELTYAYQPGWWGDIEYDDGRLPKSPNPQLDGRFTGHKMGISTSWRMKEGDGGLYVRLTGYSEGSNVQPVCSILPCSGSYGKTGLVLSFGLFPEFASFQVKMESGGLSPFHESQNEYSIGASSDIGGLIANVITSSLTKKRDVLYNFAPELQ